VTKVQLKPKVQRMQWHVPVESHSPNWTAAAPEAHQIKAASLHSVRADPGTRGLATAFLSGTALHVLHVEESLQLRHSPAYLDKEREKEKRAAGAGAGAGASGASGSGSGAAADGPAGGAGPEGDAAAPQALKVTVNKYETEQQVEARLRSFAYLAAQEEADRWVDLRYRPAGGGAAQAVRARLEGAPSLAARAAFGAEAYLDAITPGGAPPIEEQVGEGQAGGGAAGGDELGRPADAEAGAAGGAPALAPAAEAALPGALRALYRAVSVLSLDGMRAALSGMNGPPPLRRAAQGASADALHAALVADGYLRCLREVYVISTLGDPVIDPLREVVLELLQERESGVRKGDVVAAAEARGVAFSDAGYQKVVKALCVRVGAAWVLKAGGVEVTG
jgi:hypothetical protein